VEANVGPYGTPHDQGGKDQESEPGGGAWTLRTRAHGPTYDHATIIFGLDQKVRGECITLGHMEAPYYQGPRSKGVAPNFGWKNGF
jgi:hypothetical protein